MKIIIPTNNPTQQIFVDDDVYVWASRFKWNTNCYKGHACWNTTSGKKKIKYILSRLIMGDPKGMVVDHINHDPLDNRRENLRVCTQGQNTMNRDKQHKATSSIYKGVSLFKCRGKYQYWKGTINFNKKSVHLGYFNSEIKAAEAYNQAAIEYYGEYACLNQL